MRCVTAKSVMGSTQGSLLAHGNRKQERQGPLHFESPSKQGLAVRGTLRSLANVIDVHLRGTADLQSHALNPENFRH